MIAAILRGTLSCSFSLIVAVWEKATMKTSLSAYIFVLRSCIKFDFPLECCFSVYIFIFEEMFLTLIFFKQLYYPVVTDSSLFCRLL